MGLIKSFFSLILLFILWVALTITKYVVLGFSGKIYWENFGFNFFIDAPICFAIAVLVEVIFIFIARIFGISLHDAFVEGASREERMSTRYEGRIRPGILSPSVTLRERTTTTSDYEQMSNVGGFIVLVNAVLVYSNILTML